MIFTRMSIGGYKLQVAGYKFISLAPCSLLPTSNVIFIWYFCRGSYTLYILLH